MDAYDPTIEDSYNKEVEVDGRACNLEILDTAGVAQFTAMRELYIKNGQGFLLVYSVTDKKSLEELLAIKEQITRIKGTSNVPMVLIGNKCDLNDERQLEPEDGIEVSKTWNKVPFYETSAMYRMNVDDSFIDIVRQIIRKEVQQQQLVEEQDQKLDEAQRVESKSPSVSLKLNQQSAQMKTTPKVIPASQQKSQQVPKKKKNKKKCVIL